MAIICRIGGPRITTNIAGTKNKIIGTVSLEDSEPAFLSAMDILSFLVSVVRVLKAIAKGVPSFSL